MTSIEEQSLCDCWEAMVIVLQQAAELPDRMNSAAQSQQDNPVSLSERLIVGQNLVTHWEVLNGCARSEAHLGPRVLRLVADAVDRVLALYETAEGAHRVERTALRNHIGGFQDEGAGGMSTTRDSDSWSRTALDGGAMDASSGSARLQTTPPSAIYLGGLRLEAEEELVIIRQEALRNSIIRLGAMLQDVEEELRRYQSPDAASSDNSLREDEVRNLMSRLFRLLGRVNVAVG